MQKILLLSVFLFTFTNAVFCQNIHKDSIHVNFIEFGSGGGFTGESKNYIFTQSGDLYVIENILADANSLTHLKKIKKCDTKKIFRFIKKNKIADLSYNEPGNLFHYISLSVNNKKNNFVWGNSNSSAPKNIIVLYNKLYNLL